MEPRPSTDETSRSRIRIIRYIYLVLIGFSTDKPYVRIWDDAFSLTPSVPPLSTWVVLQIEYATDTSLDVFSWCQ